MQPTKYPTLLRFFSSLVLTTFIYAGLAQNLVPNYSFETVAPCPTAPGGWGPTVAAPWIGPTLGSPDIFHACGSGPAGVPDNFAGTQFPNTGDGYAGIYAYVQNSEYREYLQAPLLQPLEANTYYLLSFYISKAEFGCASQLIGAYVSADAPHHGFSNDYLDVSPQLETNQGWLAESEGWIYVSGCLLAAGGEQFITLGNFHPNSETPIENPCFGNLSYYYLDDVVLEEINGEGDIPLELGGPEVACTSYTIDPGNPGYYFIWEDGSHEPTLTVTESGVYSLTVVDGCSFGIDSIEIILHGQEPVDLGPDVIFCEGESYTISLDPTFNEYLWNDGSTDPEYTFTTPGTYSVTLDDGCSISTDEITIEVLTVPEPFDLGDDMNLCLDDELEIVLDPGLGDFLWQDMSTSSTYYIYEAGTYALTISNQCGSASDDIVVTIVESPEVNIGPDTVQLCNGETIEINIDPESGMILWQDGSESSQYIISTPGLYQVVVTNICGMVADEMEVMVALIPFVDFGDDTIICNNQELILTANGISGNFLWQDQSTNDTLVVTTPGTYSVMVSNSCGNASDTITVGFDIPVVQPVLGPDLNLCPGEQTTLYAGNPGANIMWQDGTTLDSLIVSASGTYIVTVSNSCQQFADTIVINMNGAPPAVDLPAMVTLCQGQTTMLDAGISGVTYVWNDNSTGQQVSVSSPGIYSITVSNGCGSDQDTVLVADGGPSPIVSLGNDIAICAGDMVTLSPVYTDVTSWLWHDGSTATTYTINSPGEIFVEVSNTCGLAFDTLLVSLLPEIPSLDLGADTSICQGETFTLSIAVPDVSVSWFDGSVDPDYTINGPGTYAATISNACGQSEDTMIVNLLPAIPVLDLGTDQSLCPGEVITIAPGITNVGYLWQDGSTGNTYQTTQEATIILIIANDCGTSTDTLEIIETNQGPQLDLGQDIQACLGEIVTIQSGISGVDYTWQDGSNNPDYITTQSGIFILEVNNNCGSASDTIVVDISGVPPTPILPADTTLCEGLSMTLNATSDPETTIAWQNGSSLPTFTVTSAGVYILSESNNCGEAADTITITYLDAPEPFTLGPDTTLCPGETILLSSPSTFYDILWQDGSGMLHLIADFPGVYSLQLSNACGAVTDELVLGFDTNIPQLDLDSSIPWCEGDIIQIDATQSFFADYTWNTGETTSSIQITTPGIYHVDVNVPCGSISQQVEIYPDTQCEDIEVHNDIYIPNVFSPNDDGINDWFTVSIRPDLVVTAMTGSIFDRWGNLLYASAEIPFQWNGLFEDEEVLPGVYVYQIKCSYLEGQAAREKFFAGDVTVIR
jgi:gliding motility-associated-like protein